jgi:DNA-directed RNA polymerase sigma subunit (sigma70/sigma32)
MMRFSILNPQSNDRFDKFHHRIQNTLVRRSPNEGKRSGREHTLEEVGQRFPVTRERIRQIEAKALSNLRHPSRSRKLKAFLESVRP